KVAGVLYLLGGLSALTLLALPGVDVVNAGTVVAVAAFAVAWSVACFAIVRWDRASPVFTHVSSSLGFPLGALVVWATGGAESPERFLVLFILVYAGYFYSPREAWPYVIACCAFFALPLAYDRTDAFVAEVVVMVPTLVVLGGMIIAGKMVMVALREQADDLARRDPLTGLANRRWLMDALHQSVTSGRRSADQLGLILLDLDDFKRANTVWGHPGGDAVLRATAAALEAASRDGDVVARLGGDEFAVLARGADGRQTQALTERLVAAVRAAHADEDRPGHGTTASAGWACHPADAGSVEGLIAVADRSMRAAKAGGKDAAGPAPSGGSAVARG
ncbi:MAG TPA: GGDEF domain-containing protein, partial [Capillimicrobium sp.]